MPEHHYTPAEYTLLKTVECIGNLLFQLEEHRLTHIYQVVFHFYKYENIG
jgi:hypothetical protein